MAAIPSSRRRVSIMAAHRTRPPPPPLSSTSPGGACPLKQVDVGGRGRYRTHDQIAIASDGHGCGINTPEREPPGGELSDYHKTHNRSVNRIRAAEEQGH